MRIGLAQSLAALLVIGAACASSRDEVTGGSEDPVQLIVPEAIAWEPGGPYELKLGIANYTRMILMAAEPRVEASDATIYRMDGTVACATKKADQTVYEKWAAKALQPGQRWEVKRDLHEECPLLGPGVYRYEANYRMNNAEALRSLYVAHLGPQGGKILVREGATSMKYEDLQAALENPTENELAAEQVAPPATELNPEAVAAATAAAKDEAAGKTAPAEAMPSVSEIRACVDKELLDRGLNAYGDPKGTSYGKSPPVDESGRILYVAGRNPTIRRACKVPKF
jgi:hypothetical protein